MTGKGGVGRVLRIAAPYVLLGATLPGAALYANQDDTGLIPGGPRTVVNAVPDTGHPCVASDGPFCDDATLDTSQVERPVPERRELTCSELAYITYEETGTLPPELAACYPTDI